MRDCKGGSCRGAGAGQTCAEDCCRAGGSGSSSTEAAGAQVTDTALQVSGSASGSPRFRLRKSAAASPHPEFWDLREGAASALRPRLSCSGAPAQVLFFLEHISYCTGRGGRRWERRESGRTPAPTLLQPSSEVPRHRPYPWEERLGQKLRQPQPFTSSSPPRSENGVRFLTVTSLLGLG